MKRLVSTLFPYAWRATGLGLLLFAASLTFDGRSAGASTVVRLDIAELAERADLIIEGRVLSERYVEPDGIPATEHLVQVSKTFLGGDEPYRSIRLPGGVRPDGSGMLIPGMPVIRAGSNVILFLFVPGNNGLRMPVGLGQGKLAVMTLRDGSKWVLEGQGGSGGLNLGTREKWIEYGEIVPEIIAGMARRKASDD